jgi:hypothetical protein
VAGLRALGRGLHRLHLALAANELGESAPSRSLQSRPQRPEARHLINVDRLAYAFDLGRAHRLQLKISLDELAGLLTGCNRASRRERLHPRGEIGRVPDRRVLCVSAAGRDRTHDHFARVHADTRFDRQVAGLAQSCRVAFQLFLHPKRRIQRSLRMVLVRDGRAEQRKDAVAGRLHDVAVVAPRRIDHQLQRRIDNRAGFFGVEVLLEFGRALDVGEQRGDRLALALEFFSVGRLGYPDRSCFGSRRLAGRGWS